MLLAVVAIIISAFAQEEKEDYTPRTTQSKRVIYEDPDPYKNLMDWLKDSNRADVSKVQIEVQSEGHRTLRAKQFIRAGEWIMFIPSTHYLSLDEVKKNCLINRKMIQVNYEPNNLQVYFANHLLQEKRRKNSFWKPYIDVLPTDVSGFPAYFDEEQMALLRGSPSINNVEGQRKMLKDEYESLIATFSEFKKFGYTYNDYLKYRILTISRSFPVWVKADLQYQQKWQQDQMQIQLLVPLADFVNHDNNGFIMYGYSPEQDGFFMQAKKNIERGEELFYNYGSWSNKYFFMNYGFSLLTNPMNQFDLMICLKNNGQDRLFPLKIDLTRGQMCWENRLVNETDHDTFRQTLATVRYVALDRLDHFLQLEENVQGFQQFWPGWHFRGFAVSLEKKTFTLLRDILVEALANFASTIEDDLRRLADPLTPEFRRHIIVLTLQEKQIVQKNIEICNLFLSVLDKSSEELKSLMKYYQYRDIQRYILTEIIPMKIEEGN